MSEYQYFEFQALDRPLTEREVRELRAYSSRATITRTRFVNHYEWGNFKGDPSTWMEKYFDAFLYFANCGTHALSFRLPRRVLAPKIARRYWGGRTVAIRAAGDFVHLEFCSDDEQDVDPIDDGSGWLSSLIPLRADLAAGDYRALYLGWLFRAQLGELEDSTTETTLPAWTERADGTAPGLHRVPPHRPRPRRGSSDTQPLRERRWWIIYRNR